MVAVEPEVHFVARLDAEFVAQFLRDHDLPLRPHTMSHTVQYNPRDGLDRPAGLYFEVITQMPSHVAGGSARSCSQRAT